MLCAFELTWFVYVALLLPVFLAVLTHADPRSERQAIERLLPLMPIVVLVTLITWGAAIYDIRRNRVPKSAVWISAFLFVGAVALPVYFVRHVLRSGPDAPQSQGTPPN
jgi:hypothetical protein